MNGLNNIFSMLAGVAFFLMSMNMMEDVLHTMAGRRFKLFLKRLTTRRLKAVLGGILATGMLQSSSVVNLMVLSMVGAGVLQMENALALLLGSNLGSTLNSWLVAGIGFSYSINSVVLPVAGISGIIMAFLRPGNILYGWSRFLFSLAFLFIALGFIREGMEGFVNQTDLSAYNRYPLFVFLLIGVVVTATVQSSAATMALTLSALFAHAIAMPAAMAIVLGSEIGTTLKLFPASIRGTPEKKRLALANFGFNVITVGLLYVLIRPVYQLLTEVWAVNDPLIALVCYQTFINCCTLLIFLPVLKPVSAFLMKRYQNGDERSLFISKVPVTDADAAIEALDQETAGFISLVISYGMTLFQLPEQWPEKTSVYANFTDKEPEEQYAFIKRLHGEMHGYYLLLQNNRNQKLDTVRLDQLIAAIRNCMYAAKNIRDTRQDIDQLKNSSNDSKYGYYLASREKVRRFYGKLSEILRMGAGKAAFDPLIGLQETVTNGYLESLKELYRQNTVEKVNETEITTFINFNREIYTSFKSMVFGLKEYMLTADDAAYFDSLPGFIR